MEQLLEHFSDPQLSLQLMHKVKVLAAQYKSKHGRKPALMEVCGSHTMALARTGIKAALSDDIELISGPGCPVCVTDQSSIDAMIHLSEGENRIICTFGDMIRVPGSRGSLLDAKTEGRDIRIVYSPSDSIRIAEEHPDKDVIFLGIGFETTIPVLAVALKEANEKKLGNFSMWMTTKLVEPILRVILEEKDVQVDGLLLPGHVAIVVGSRHFSFLASEYGIPGAITGFYPAELLIGIHQLLVMLMDERKEILNMHPRAVSESGNLEAQEIMNNYLRLSDEGWRGMGKIPLSGMDIRKEYAHLNAKERFAVPMLEPQKTKCRCGDIIRGRIKPEECSLYGKACIPARPMGPCMVSGEGTCHAHYQFMREATV